MITNGILNINKPQNMTSHDVVSIVRRTLGIKRVGHTGTLDPMATGVLPVCVGKSTRIMEYLDMDIKEYRCSMVLGMETDTQDIWGETLAEADASSIAEADIEAAFAGFDGVIDQKPPMYSALKVNGKKLYEYAREGKEVDVKSRKVFIDSLIAEPWTPGNPVTFTVRCSKGTYIRTICQDLGKILGCGAALCSLQRTRSGIFNVEDAVDLDTLREMDKDAVEQIMYRTEEPLVNFGEVHVDAVTAVRFINGWHVDRDEYEVIREPRYASEEFPLEIRDEFRRAYNVFGEHAGDYIFLGVAFYSSKYKKLVADKVTAELIQFIK